MDECDLNAMQRAVEQKRVAAAAEHATIVDDRSHQKRIAEISAEMGDLTPDQFENRRRESLEREGERLQMARWDRWRAFIARRGDRYAECRVSNYATTCEDQKHLAARITTYCRSISTEIAEGVNVILFGKMGTGKDHLLSAMARHAILEGKLVDWWNGMDLFGRMRDRIGDGDSEEAFVRTLARPNVLYISDPLPPGEEPLTAFQMQFISRVIDARYSRNKATWISVNVTGRQDFEKRFGAPAVDRLCENAVTWFCNWPSYRQGGKP